MELFYRAKGIFKRQRKQELITPKKILLCNHGALGDVFLTTCMIPPLKKAFASCQIGLWISPRSKAAVEGCPNIDFIHESEPWFDPRDSKWEKIKKRRQLICPNYEYDWVICSYPFFRGVGSCVKNIQTRICFDSLGDRTHFTHVIPWESAYIGAQYNRLLEQLGAGPLTCPWKLSCETKDYALFHIGPLFCIGKPYWDVRGPLKKGVVAPFEHCSDMGGYSVYRDDVMSVCNCLDECKKA